MKIIILNIIVAITVAACNAQTTTITEQPNTKAIKAIKNMPIDINHNNTKMYFGLLETSEVTTYQYGTHSLKGNVLDGNPDNMTKKVLFALKSDLVKLDHFNGKKVIVTGNKIAGYPIENGPDFIEVIAIENDQIAHIAK
jgi:hypothetical protein